MTRYAAMFARVRAAGAGAFIPFTVLGDPDPDTSLAIVHTLAEAGADALELGIPFSDPVADGPTIQAADVRALQAGTRQEDAFRILTEVRRRHPGLPIGLLVYANLVEGRGRDVFYQRCAEAGVDSVLVADVPTLEAHPYVEAATRHGIDPVFIAPPNADDDALAAIAAASRGYTYVVTRVGVTGAEQEAQGQDDLLAALKRHGAPPSVLGFGISTPAHVRAALASGAAGAISGSAVVQHIAGNLGDREAMLAALGDFTRQMSNAARDPGNA